MNYSKIYYTYMEYVKTLNRNENDAIFYEIHHIIPKSIDPSKSKDPSNLVLLTLREHYLAHLTLYKMYEGEDRQKMALALDMLRKSKKYKITSSRFFERIRLEANKYQSERQKGKTLSESHKESLKKNSARKGKPSPFKDKHHSLEALEKNKNSHLGKSAWNKGKPRIAPVSETTRKKLSEANKGRILSKEHKEKISQSHKGLMHSEETKKKIQSRIERYELLTGKRIYLSQDSNIPEGYVTFEEYKNSPFYIKRSYIKHAKN